MSRGVFDRGWPWYVAAALLISIYALSLVERRALDPRPIGSLDDVERLASRSDVNVMFVLIDTLRAERLGSWGYERETSPTMDWLAESGIRFSRHLSQSSWTKASMWTALYPQRTRVRRFNDVISPEATLPAEIFREAGFRTVGLWRNGWVAPTFGFEQGFDIYHRPASLPLGESELRQNPTMVAAGSDEGLLESVRSFLVSSPPERRWFMYLHLMDLHQYTYDSDSALFGTTFSDVYDNSVRREDTVVAALVDALMNAGVFDETVIVIASDHGEAFGERGFEGHAQNVFRETTEVPLIVSFPFRLESGIVVSRRTRNIDIWPTLLDLFGLPEMSDVDGESMLPIIRAAARGERPDDESSPSFAELDQHWGRPSEEYAPTVAATQGDYRYLLWTKGGRVEALYDAASDPKELTDVLRARDDVAEALREAARAYLEESPAPPWGDDAPTVELDEMQLNHLRALGYKI